MNDIDKYVEGVLNGESQLFETIVEMYESDVRAVISAMIPDYNMVPDITQETFITVYKRLDTYKPGTNFRAWIKTIARNMAQNERRRWYKGHDFKSQYKVEVEQQIEDEINAIIDTLPEHVLDAINDCVGHLQDKTRSIVDGFYFEEDSLKKISDRLKIPLNTVKVTLHRARQALGNCLQKKGGSCDA